MVSPRNSFRRHSQASEQSRRSGSSRTRDTHLSGKDLIIVLTLEASAGVYVEEISLFLIANKSKKMLLPKPSHLEKF